MSKMLCCVRAVDFHNDWAEIGVGVCCIGILRCVHELLPACLSTFYRIIAMVSFRATGETAKSLQ